MSADLRRAARDAAKCAARMTDPADLLSVPEAVEQALDLAKYAEALHRLADLEAEASIADDELDVPPFMFRKPETEPVHGAVEVSSHTRIVDGLLEPKLVLSMPEARIVQHALSFALGHGYEDIGTAGKRGAAMLVFLDETFGPAL